MSSSTNLISGLSSGFDWRTMVDQLIAVEHRRVDMISNKKTDSQKKLAEWQSFNTKLLALKMAAGSLKNAEAFNVYKASMSTDSPTVKASDLLTVTASTTASIGSYSIKVNSLAMSQKISSSSFTSMTDVLGPSYAGDLLINGRVVSIAVTDTLTSMRDKINNANAGANPTGVTAGILNYGAGDYRLVLTSDNTGASGIGLLNGGAIDILARFGFTDSSRSAKNHLAGGDRTDSFSSTNVSIKSLLGLTSNQTSLDGEITINGKSIVAIDLSTDTLSSLQTKLATAGLTISITSETENNQTYYRLMVSGAANTYTDKNNILETLGFIHGGVSDVYGVTGDVANTTGGAVITTATLIKDIDGYTGYLNGDYIHLGGKDTNGVDVSDDTFMLSDTATVGDLLTKIQSLFGDVTASVSGAGKLTIMDNTSGASPLAVQISVKNSGGTTDETLKFDANGDLEIATPIRKRQIMAGADASVTVDGVTVTRSENTIDDIIAGVTLDLLKGDMGSTTVTLNIGRDSDAIMAKINTFVAEYNSVSSYIRTQISYDETKKEPGGILFADGTLLSVKSDLTSTLIQNVWGVSADYSTLGLVGINVDEEGQLSVNSSTLQSYLATHFNDVRNLFTASGVTSVGTLAYVSNSIDTKQGEYKVHIDTAATQSASPSSDNNSLVGGDLRLTITEAEKIAMVNLTDGMSMAQIVSAVNSELAMVYTQVLAGANQLYADSGQVAAISSSTKWNSIYNEVGGSANLVNGDMISFTGTSRNGSSISGSYRISNIATDSVQDLLSVVETAYSNQVTATIDASGRIMVTDKTPGNSSVALTFDFTQAHDLDVGTVLTSNTNGQKGRYVMDIAASIDSGGHLVMTHNSYGSGNSFTIQQTDPILLTPSYLLWTGADPTVIDGVNVTGTINGEAANGAGQTLTGNSGEANINGLVIKYTGKTVGDVGTIKLTLGVAELYDRALFHITDSIEGYVSFKQESVQNSISEYETQIEEMEARLDRKSEALINRFVQMELALQQIQSQSNWLAGQLTTVSSGWMNNE
jgi:flagellar hook-associated protein 2